MNALTLRLWPDSILTKKCAPVAEVTDEIRATARGMLDVMYKNRGIGLAAPQVGLLLRMFVVDVGWPITGSHGKARIFINPVITPGPTMVRTEEGCLSVPGINEFVTRSSTVHVEALDETGNPFSLDADGTFAICIQHEHDHLEGITLVDKLGRVGRRMLKKSAPSGRPIKK